MKFFEMIGKGVGCTSKKIFDQIGGTILMNLMNLFLTVVKQTIKWIGGQGGHI